MTPNHLGLIQILLCNWKFLRAKERFSIARLRASAVGAHACHGITLHAVLTHAGEFNPQRLNVDMPILLKIVFLCSKILDIFITSAYIIRQAELVVLLIELLSTVVNKEIAGQLLRL